MENEMFRYLLKYVGKYRVLTELTTDSDFVKDENGNIDPEYDELYINCKFNCILKHTYKKDILAIFCPDKVIGKKVISKFKSRSIEYTLDDFCEEYIIYFNDKDLPIVNKFMKLQTVGKNLNPFIFKEQLEYEPKKDLVLKSHTVEEPVSI